MKKILLLSVFLIYSLIHSQQPSGCGSLAGSSIVNMNTETTFFLTTEPEFGYLYNWQVTGDLEIVGPNHNNSVNVKGTSPNGNGTVFGGKYKHGVDACASKKNVTVSNLNNCATQCNNVVVNVGTHSCSQDIPTGIPYNTKIFVSAYAQNPFDSPATVVLKWNPLYVDGQMINAVNPNAAACSNGGGPTDFYVNFIPNPPNNQHYLPMIFEFTDLATETVCTIPFTLTFEDCESGNPH